MKIAATLLCSFMLTAFSAFADDKPFKEFGDNRVYYSAFNSSFIDPDIAGLHNISRGKDKGLVNIAVVPEGGKSGETALVSGTANDLLQRQQILDFVEIREGDAVYYLAPFSFENEDPLTINISVRPAGASTTHEFSFQRTFYHD